MQRAPLSLVLLLSALLSAPASAGPPTGAGAGDGAAAPGGAGGGVTAGGGAPVAAAVDTALGEVAGDDPAARMALMRKVAPIMSSLPRPGEPGADAAVARAIEGADLETTKVLSRIYGLVAPNPTAGGVTAGGPGGATGGHGPRDPATGAPGGPAGAGGPGGASDVAGHGGGRFPGAGGHDSVPPAWDLRLRWNRHHADIEPENPAPRVEIGNIEYYSGNNQAAFDSYGKAISLGNKDPQTIASYGRAAYGLGDYRLAEKSGQTALGMDPNNQDADALVKLARGRVGKVSLPSALGALGAVAGDGGAGAGAAAAAASALGSGGGAGASASSAYGDSAGGRTAAEIAAAAARLAATPPSKVAQSSALTREAAQALTVKDYEAAHAIATQAIDLNPQNAQAWNYRGIADNKLGRYSDAVYDSSFALTLAPGNAPALQTRSWAFSKEKKYKEGLADANYTLEKEPDNSFAYQNRAFALAGMGDRAGALQSLKRSAEIDERFKPKYEAALQSPEDADLLFLFNEEPGRPVGPAQTPEARKKRFLRLILLSMTGGVIVALGLLNIISAGFREKMGATIRRFTGAGAPGSGEASGAGSAADGAVWAQYELVKTIGTGGMGVVYEAMDNALGRRVAVKKMRDEIRADPVERRRFVQEARTVAALHHPNIVDIYAIIEDSGDVYLVFEYVAGRTLADLVGERGPLGFDEARKLLKGACDAVGYAHRHAVIHRDIKPSNIMLSEDGHVKVMDFGVARQAKEAVTKMAMTNTIVGTPPYMAPEQEQGTVRKESDVFSLGVVFYEMLCGELPFAGQGAGMLLNKINGRHVPVTTRKNAGLPPGLDAVLAKALAADPAVRYTTPEDFLAAVEHLSAARAG